MEKNKRKIGMDRVISEHRGTLSVSALWSIGAAGRVAEAAAPACPPMPSARPGLGCLGDEPVEWSGVHRFVGSVAGTEWSLRLPSDPLPEPTQTHFHPSK